MKFGIYLADNLADLGRVYNVMGDNVRALIYLNQALAVAKRLPYRDRAANILNSLGILYLEQEDYEKGADYLDQSLQIYLTPKNQAEAAKVLLNLGVADQRQGDTDRALEYFRKSFQQAKEIPDKDVMIAAGEGIGVAHREKGDYPAALETLDQSLLLAREIDDQTRIAEILWRKAEVHLAMKKHAEAATLAESANKLARQLRLPKLSYLTAATLGKAYLHQRKFDQALNLLTQAIEQVEAMRMQIAGQEQERQLFFEDKAAAYHSLVELFISQSRPVDALLYAERAKGRVLLDVLSGRGVQITKAMTQQEKEEEQRLNRSIIEINNEIRNERLKPSPDASRLSQLTARLGSARLSYAAFQDLLSATHPESKS